MLTGAPWRLDNPQLETGQMHYHIVLAGSVVLEEPTSGPPQRLIAGDILLLSYGVGHILHDGSGSGIAPEPAQNRRGPVPGYVRAPLSGKDGALGERYAD